jgi:hypothetical protein
MSSTKSTLRLIGALAALACLALAAVSCQGFFPPKTLTSITVDPPTPAVDIGSTLQMYATGTYSDGSTGSLNSGTSCTGSTVCWTESSGGSVTSITSGGLVTGVADGTSTVTATASGISGDTTVTVALANVTGLVLKPTSLSVFLNETTTVQCFAETSGGEVDVTATCVWSVSPTTAAQITGGEDPAVVEGETVGSATVTATYSTASNPSGYTASATLNVTQ